MPVLAATKIGRSAASDGILIPSTTGRLMAPIPANAHVSPACETFWVGEGLPSASSVMTLLPELVQITTLSTPFESAVMSGINPTGTRARRANAKTSRRVTHSNDRCRPILALSTCMFAVDDEPQIRELFKCLSMSNIARIASASCDNNCRQNATSYWYPARKSPQAGPRNLPFDGPAQSPAG